MMIDMDNQIKKNTVFHLVETFASYFLSFLTVFYTARVLQPESLGSVAFCSSVISYFTMFAQMGIPIYGMRYTAQNRDSLKQPVFELVLLECLLTVITYLIFLVLILQTGDHTVD